MCPGHGTIPGEDHGDGLAQPGAASLSGGELSCAHGVHHAGVRPMLEQRTWAQIQTTSVNLSVVSALSGRLPLASAADKRQLPRAG